MLAFDEMRCGAEIVEAGIRAGADEDAVHGNIRDRRAGFEAHVFQCAFGSFLIVRVFEVVRVRDARRDARDHAGICAPSNLRRYLFGLQLDCHIEFGIFIGMQLFPALDGFLKFLAAGNEGPAFEVGERGVVRRYHSGACATFDGHVAHGHAAFHGKFADGLTAVFRDVACAAADSDFSDDGENDVFRGDAFRPLSMNENVKRFRFRLDEALRRENVLDFARADAKSERAEGAVRGSVAVAADDGLSGLRDAEFRADDVDDALIFAVHVEQTNARFAAILFESFKLEAGIRVHDGEGAAGGGHGVIHYSEGEIGAADFAAFGFESGEGLRGSALVDEVAVNIDERWFAGFLMNEVGIPDFFVECFL